LAVLIRGMDFTFSYMVPAYIILIAWAGRALASAGLHPTAPALQSMSAGNAVVATVIGLAALVLGLVIRRETERR